MKKKKHILYLLSIVLALEFFNFNYNIVNATNESESKEDEEIKYVPMGEYSILNNEFNGIDYKIEDLSSVEIFNNYVFQKDTKVKKKATAFSVQDFSEVKNNPYLSYLIENNFISRRVQINASTNSCAETTVADSDCKQNTSLTITSGNALMSKSDLYMALYKICYGVELSNPIALRYEMKPSIPTKSDEYEISENTYVYYPDGGVVYYQSPNVYEIYLTKLLEKGLISMRDLNLIGLNSLNEENNFEKNYNVIQKGMDSSINANIMPVWYNYTCKNSWQDILTNNKSSLEALIVSSQFSSDNGYSLYRKLLGNSIIVSNYNESTGCIKEYYVTANSSSENSGDYKTVGYFAKEKMTISDALKIIEKMLRATEKEMTRIEAELINYKYGVTILDSMTEEEKNTVSFLIAKGILNFDENDENSDKELYSDLSADFTWEDSWKLLYRVANKEARYDFSKLQLTDSEFFWQEKGYAENEINVYGTDSTPYMEVISATKASVDADGQLTILDEQEISAGDYESLDGETEDNSDDSAENLISKIIHKLDKLFITETYATNSDNVTTVGNTCYEVRIILANQYNGVDVQYKYGEEELSPSKVNVIEDLVGYNNTDYPGYTIYTFKISASTRNRAIALLHTRLKAVSINAPIGSMMGVTTMTNGSTGKTTTLISKDAITENLSEIKIVNNNTLMNTETGVMVTMLPNQESLGGQSIAFCGNKVIICDDMIVTDNTSQIYYNLEVLCSILPNATLKKINGATSLVRTSILQENLYQIIDSDSNVIENNYVATFENFNDDQGNSTSFYNLDSATRSLNCLERTWDLQAKDKSGRVQNIKVTMIVEWNYSVPTQAAVGSSVLMKTDSSEDFTLEDVNTFLNTKPSSEALACYWDRNLEMSNALVRMMYGDTQKTQYITCGYLVPSVYILSTGGAGLENGEIGNDSEPVFVSDTSLSYVQLNQFFKKLNFSQQYIASYLGGDKANWWDSFYRNFPCEENAKNPEKCTGSACKNYYVHNLMDNQNCFKVYAPATISVQDGGTSNIFYAFGTKENNGEYKNAKFIVTSGNTVYRSIENDPRCSKIQAAVGDKSGILKIDTKTDNLMVVPKFLDNVVIDGTDIVLKYLSTESLYNMGVYRFVISDTGNSLNFKETFKCHFTGKTATDTTTLANYINKKGLTPSDYTKKAAQLLNSFYAGSVDAVYYQWNDNYYNELDNIKYVATWEKYKSGKTVGKIQKLSNLSNGTFKTRSNLDVSRFSEVSSKDIINIIVPVFYKTNDCYIVQDGGVLKLKHGSGLNVLNTGIYFVGLNGIVRDKLLAKDANVIKVSGLDQGDIIYINNKKFTMTKDGYLQSTLQIAQPNTAIQIATQYLDTKSADSGGIKSAILQTFNGYGIHTGGRVYSFASFVNDVKLSGLDNSVKSSGGMLLQQVYRKSKKVYCYTRKGAVELTDSTINECSPNSYKFSMKVSDELICRPLNDIGTVYELVQVTDAYAGTGMGNLPFVLTDALDTEETKTILSFSETSFRVTAFTNEIKTKFLDEYKEMLSGDIWSFCRLIGIAILGYLMVITWIVTFMLKMPIVKNTLLAIAQPDGRNHKGLDLIKIVTLGIYSTNDDPSISKLLIMDILFTIIMYFILNGFG